jgi:hypothetical protein
MDRSLRRQLQPVSYTENQPSSDSELEYDNEYNSHQSTNILSISPGSIESTSVSDMPTPMLHQVAAGSSPARKRIQQACDTCRRKKSKVRHSLIAPSCLIYPVHRWPSLSRMSKIENNLRLYTKR